MQLSFSFIEHLEKKGTSANGSAFLDRSSDPSKTGSPSHVLFVSQWPDHGAIQQMLDARAAGWQKQ